MSAETIAAFLQAYPGRTHKGPETQAEREARITAWEALDPFERELASLLYTIDNQVAFADPQRSVTFFAEMPQGWARQIRHALELAAQPALEAPSPEV